MLEGKAGDCGSLHRQMTLDLQNEVSEQKHLFFSMPGFVQHLNVFNFIYNKQYMQALLTYPISLNSFPCYAHIWRQQSLLLFKTPPRYFMTYLRLAVVECFLQGTGKLRCQPQNRGSDRTGRDVLYSVNYIFETCHLFVCI